MSAFYTAIAICGSITMSCSSLPQICHVHKRKSSEDISLYYQVLFLAGTLMFLVYYGYYSLWAIFYPTLFSFCLILYFIGLKVRLGSFAPRGLRGFDEGIDFLGPSGSPRPATSGSTEMVGPGTRGSASTEATPVMSSW